MNNSILAKTRNVAYNIRALHIFMKGAVMMIKRLPSLYDHSTGGG